MGEEHQEAESLSVARAKERKETDRQVDTNKHLMEGIPLTDFDFDKRIDAWAELKIEDSISKVFIILFLSSFHL